MDGRGTRDKIPLNPKPTVRDYFSFAHLSPSVLSGPCAQLSRALLFIFLSSVGVLGVVSFQLKLLKSSSIKDGEFKNLKFLKFP